MKKKTKQPADWLPKGGITLPASSDEVYICELCQRAYEPEEEELAEGGVRRLKTFKGYTVDLRLLEFRKAINRKRLEFIPFNSPKGRKLLAQMHEEVTR